MTWIPAPETGLRGETGIMTETEGTGTCTREMTGTEIVMASDHETQVSYDLIFMSESEKWQV